MTVEWNYPWQECLHYLEGGENGFEFSSEEEREAFLADHQAMALRDLRRETGQVDLAKWRCWLEANPFCMTLSPEKQEEFKVKYPWMHKPL